MSVPLFELGLNPDAPILPDSPCYRPPSWPPPDDWVVSVDASGLPVSRWGDDFHDFSLWAGISTRFHYVGGPRYHVDVVGRPENQSILRMIAGALLWAPYGAKTWSYARICFSLLRKIVVACDREGVVASQLWRHQRLLDLLPSLYKHKQQKKLVVTLLDRLLRLQGTLGFCLVDETGITAFVKAINKTKTPDTVQTPYIPSRIWTYQVSRLRECIDNFLEHKQQIQDCYNFCVDAYIHNFGSLENALFDEHTDKKLPFTLQVNKHPGQLNGRKYYGGFIETAQRFGIEELLRTWVTPPSADIDLRQLGTYLSLLEFVGHAYIANFTLQRSAEVAALRADCLHWEQDPVMGRIAIICGETTKTDPDSDARWPTSAHVEVAVEALTCVANLRMRCAKANPQVGCSEYDIANPFLVHSAFEPWGGRRAARPYAVRPTLQTYQEGIAQFARLFDLEELRITEEDMKTAMQFTPNLTKRPEFQVGKIWPLAHHQLRRTTGINMFASDMLSDTSIQVIMKHLTLLQTHYYLRNYSRLKFNNEVERVVVEARYETLGRQIEAVVKDEYISPHGEKRKEEIVVNLLSAKEFKELVSAGQKGQVSFRAIRLGGCTKRGHCDYGGIESVARCAGGDRKKPCLDVLFDKRKRASVARQLASAEKRLEGMDLQSPRAQALLAEVRGYRRFLDDTRT
jgi:hypothetical protein